MWLQSASFLVSTMTRKHLITYNDGLVEEWCMQCDEGTRWKTVYYDPNKQLIPLNELDRRVWYYPWTITKRILPKQS
jgi:hypothetical protein